MPHMTFRYRILPGGRRVRDVPPDMTVEETLEFAGESELQAEAALAEEKSRERPRKGVTEALETDE